MSFLVNEWHWMYKPVTILILILILSHSWNTFVPPTLQYNLNGSNTDGSFTLDDSNSFLVPTKSFQ